MIHGFASPARAGFAFIGKDAPQPPMGGLGAILVGTGMRLLCLNKRVNAPVGRPAEACSPCFTNIGKLEG